MKTNPKKLERKSPRMKGYDYSLPGAYFVTMVTHQRKHLFGDVVEGKLQLNRYGKIVEHAWMDFPSHYHSVTLEAFIVMPNHVHGILIINDILVEESKDIGRSQVKYGLSEIVRAFKSFSARKINNLRKARGVPAWQRSYFDRIIRNERELADIAEYIRSNPINWQDDELLNMTTK